jgi:hypothetical protein
MSALGLCWACALPPKADIRAASTMSNSKKLSCRAALATITLAYAGALFVYAS